MTLRVTFYFWPNEGEPLREGSISSTATGELVVEGGPFIHEIAARDAGIVESVPPSAGDDFIRAVWRSYSGSRFFSTLDDGADAPRAGE